MLLRMHTLVSIPVLTALYFAAGNFGLSWAVLHPSASAVWPPSGIALAALLLYGYRLWPGVFLGAFLVNITTPAGPASTIGIAVGNTLEALLAAGLVRRFCDGPKAFERARNIPKFILFAIVSTALGATFGVTSLTIGRVASGAQYQGIWLTWWLGDLVGVLMITPLLVLWMTQPFPSLKRRAALEMALLLAGMVVVAWIVFLSRIPSGLEYLTIPPVLWAAFRFGERGAVTVAFLMSAVAVWGASRGLGPFTAADPGHSLLLLQFFMGAVAATGLVLASALAERKRAQDALRDNESRLRLAMTTGRMGAWEWNIATNEVTWSPNLEAIHGLKPGTFGGGFDDFKRDVHPDDLARLLGEIRKTVESRGDYHAAYRIVRPAGDVRWVEAFGTVVLASNREPEKLLGICMDVTERKNAEQVLQQARDALARSNEDLERRVRQRTAELEEANAALLRDMEEQKMLQDQLRHAQKMESIGTLAGGVAHDFNNLLNIIKGYASLLGRRRSEDRELADTLKVIDETIERGASTVRQLLALGRNSEIQFEPLDLNGVLENLMRLLTDTFPRTIDILADLDPDLPRVMADPNQINQVMLNICVNARDAMAEGGELLIATGISRGEELRERFQEARDDLYVCISVADTGSGMGQVVKSRIFEPFFTTKDQGQGTGLGLSVVYGIIIKHRGFIDVASERGRGTTFRVYLPAADRKAGAIDDKRPAEPKPPAPARAAAATILFVEDEVKQLELMGKFLESEGYSVLLARDGAEAFETYLRHKDEIAAVILDLGLPKLNGWEVFQQIKQIDPLVRPILATGYLSAEMESAVATRELSAVIMKPYRLDQVVRAISAAIADRASPVAAPDPAAT